MIYFFSDLLVQSRHRAQESVDTEHDLRQSTISGSLWTVLSGAETLKNGHSLLKYHCCSPCL